MVDLDALGRVVREAWVAYCIETGDTKPSHIAPWDDLSEWDKEADRRIGAAIARHLGHGPAPLTDGEIIEAVKAIDGAIEWNIDADAETIDDIYHDILCRVIDALPERFGVRREGDG